MSDWVRFHRELCEGDKRGLARATRFVYLELSRLARARRGWIALPVGMSDEDGVVDILGGNRREVLEALKALRAEAHSMIRFDTIEGKRALIVVEWEKWNPVDRTAAERQQRRRDKRSGHERVTRDDDVTHGDETDPRAHARLSSPLLSDGSGSQPEDPPKTDQEQTGNRPRLASNAADDGEAGFAVGAWMEGVRSVTGRSVTWPTRGEAQKLIAAFDAHGPARGDAGRCDWARQKGAEWAGAATGEISVWAFTRWIDTPEERRQSGTRKVGVPVQPMGGFEFAGGGGTKP